MKEKRTKDSTLTGEITTILEEIREQPKKDKQKGEPVVITQDNKLMIGSREYLLVKNYREGFDPKRLGERFSDILSKYDYVVGDWGNDQLRLKGFFSATNHKSAPDQRINALEDYLYEYCNFGCAYFVLKRLSSHQKKQRPRRKKTVKKNPTKNQNTNNNKKVMDSNTNKKSSTRKENRTFTIRQREG